MLETLDLQRSLDKESYQEQIQLLMQKLRSLQKSCWENKLPVIVVLEGWAAAGKGALLKQIVGYMDPRGFSVHPIWPPTAEERQYPFMWRFWQRLPAAGNIGVFYHSWYTHVLEDRLFDRVSAAEIGIVMRQINAFERQMVDDGRVIVKFWLHLSQKELKKRLKKASKDPLEAWRVRPEDWQQAKNYDTYCAFAEEMVTYTSTGPAPWTLVEAHDSRWTGIKVLTQMVNTISEALERRQIRTPVPQLPPQEHLEPTAQGRQADPHRPRSRPDPA